MFRTILESALLRRPLAAFSLLLAALCLAVALVPPPAGAARDADPTPQSPAPAVTRTAPIFDSASVLSATTLLDRAVPLRDAGGGARDTTRIEPLTPAARQAIQQAIDANIARLGLAQPGANSAPAIRPSLGWPIEPVPTLDVFDPHGIANYVDHDPRYPSHVLDYNCGQRTYDTRGGYNHAGTDFFTWPFPWLWEADSQVEIVAAAPGTIIHKADGNFDQCCAFSNLPWNAVYIRHADGSVAWYGHMKKYSLTFKAVGDTVVAGEYLGIVGSSGDSTGPHLHFELHDPGGSVLDPWFGNCNTGIGSSWWDAQRPYYDPGINLLTTGTAAPELLDCPPGTETPHTASFFKPGDTIYFTSYYRDQMSGWQARSTVYRPGGSIYQRWTTSFTTYYDASWWYASYTLDPGVPIGRWTYEVVYGNQTYQKDFQVGPTLYPLLYLPLITQ